MQFVINHGLLNLAFRDELRFVNLAFRDSELISGPRYDNILPHFKSKECNNEV